MDWALERLEGLDEVGQPIDRLTMTEDDLTFEIRIRPAKTAIRSRIDEGIFLSPDPSDDAVPDECRAPIAAAEEE